MHFIKTKRSFKKEFKRQLRFSIAAAIGFTIAFSWRNAVYDSLFAIVQRLTDATRNTAIEAYTALFITLIGVVVILITSRLLRD